MKNESKLQLLKMRGRERARDGGDRKELRDGARLSHGKTEDKTGDLTVAHV